MRLAAPTRDDRAGTPPPAGRPPAPDEPTPRGPWHERLTIAAAAVGTLVVIVAAMFGSGGRDEPSDPQDRLTELGRRALETLPDAIQSGDSVIVPALPDDFVARANYIDPSLFRTPPVSLDVRGLAAYGSMRAPIGSPTWTAMITAEDNIFVDVGPLAVACMSWPGEETCAPTLLAAYSGHYYVFKSGVGSETFLQPGSDMEGFIFDAVSGRHRVRLIFGGLHGTRTERVELALMDGTMIPAEMSVGTPFADATIWWSTTAQSVRSVFAYDAAEQVIGSVHAVP